MEISDSFGTLTSFSVNTKYNPIKMIIIFFFKITTKYTGKTYYIDG
jgi:hypothetical protein